MKYHKSTREKCTYNKYVQQVGNYSSSRAAFTHFAFCHISIMLCTWQSRLLCWPRWHPSVSSWRWRDPGASACSPAPAHPLTRAGWRCTGWWGPVPVAAGPGGRMAGGAKRGWREERERKRRGEDEKLCIVGIVQMHHLCVAWHHATCSNAANNRTKLWPKSIDFWPYWHKHKFIYSHASGT